MPFGYCCSLIQQIFFNTFYVSGTVPNFGNSEERYRKGSAVIGLTC